MDLNPAVVMVTTAAPDLGCANQLAEALLTRRLAACVQISAGHSVYRWQQQLQSTPEYYLQIKTRGDQLPAIEALLAELHPYQLPELLVLPIITGSAAYLGWINDNTGN